jgi:N-acetylmuramic acid 6-phosphate etherase
MSTPDILASLATEDSDPRYDAIDTQSVAELAELMNDADASVPGAVRRALPQIVPAIEATAARMADGGRLVYVGAGTPGRIGVLDASECPPTFNTPPELVFAIIAGGAGAITSPIEGAEDDADAGAAAIDAAGIGPRDTVIGIASSGRTPFVVAAVARARERGALAVGLSCNTGTALSAAAEHGIEIELGPEFVTGSTRLKAGTAQKLVLNMFSTITMVRLGKTYGSLMVDVRASNHKLRERAIRMLTVIARVDRDTAERTLTAVDFDVKTAAVMLVRAVDRAHAAELLASAGGRLRSALEAS